ncbi:carboxylesterase/lipase family protein [Asticcacaulis biprosthecium]|nr:carboxylesterase family protein [Asticcacaulis biprosthecium]
MIRNSLIGLTVAVLATTAAAQTPPPKSPNGRFNLVIPPGRPKVAPPTVMTAPPVQVQSVQLAPVQVPPAHGEPIAQQTVEAPPPAPPAPAGARPDIVVATTAGQLGGEALWDGSHVFRAVPFARPPVGDLRWRAPQDPTPWQGVRYATESAAACLQVDLGWQSAMSRSSSEDCLYLEVRTPDTARKLPVMVFIHGGANRAGGATGTVMAGFAPKGVVIVSIPYRLGALGFLSHPALTQEQGGASGNYALMDQVKALEWVRDNIAAFGGDPGNVTIFGHSAGAQDVGLLLTSPLAKGLFHKAISQSGPPQFGLPARTLAQNEAIGVELASEISMSPPDSAQALADLRRQPAISIQELTDKIPPPVEDASFIWLQAIVDGKALPRAPQDVFRAGEAARVPLIIGVSAQELGLHGGEANIYKAVFNAFGLGRFRAMSFYRIDKGKPPKADPLLGDTAMQISTDIMMRCPADWTAAQMTQAGNEAYLYHLGVDKDGKIHHGSELNFVMNPRPDGQGDAVWPPLLDHWVAFATTGNPNGPGLPQWPAYGGDKAYIDFTTSGPYARTQLRGPVCALRDTP